MCQDLFFLLHHCQNVLGFLVTLWLEWNGIPMYFWFVFPCWLKIMEHFPHIIYTHTHTCHLYYLEKYLDHLGILKSGPPSHSCCCHCRCCCLSNVLSTLVRWIAGRVALRVLGPTWESCSSLCPTSHVILEFATILQCLGKTGLVPGRKSGSVFELTKWGDGDIKLLELGPQSQKSTKSQLTWHMPQMPMTWRVT